MSGRQLTHDLISTNRAQFRFIQGSESFSCRNNRLHSILPQVLVPRVFKEPAVTSFSVPQSHLAFHKMRPMLRWLVGPITVSSPILMPVMSIPFDFLRIRACRFVSPWRALLSCESNCLHIKLVQHIVHPCIRAFAETSLSLPQSHFVRHMTFLCWRSAVASKAISRPNLCPVRSFLLP